MIDDNPNLKIMNGVIELSGGNLFLRQKDQGQRQFDFLTRKSAVSKSDTDNFITNIAENENFCEELGIQYAHVIFPCKAIAYKKQFDEIGVKVTPIVSTLHLANKKVFYPDQSLISNNWYHKTDTHCSYIGYLNILKGVFKIADLEFPKLKMTIAKRHMKGDLAIMCNADDIEVDYIKDFGHKPDIHRFSNVKALSGNSGEIYFTLNNKPLVKKRLLLFGDSFFVGSLNILSNIFEEVCYIRSSFILKDIALCLKPDVIFTGCAERYLTKVASFNDAPPFFLNYFKKNTSFDSLSSETIDAFSCFFLQRTSGEYLKWRKKLEFKKLLELSDDKLFVLASNNTPLLEFIRDTAISLELVDIKKAMRLMSIAYKIRPHGPLISRKLKKYEKLSGEC